MDNIFFVAGIISIIFFITKFLEMRFIEKESKPLKYLVRDTLVVYISVITGHFIVEQLSPIVNETIHATVTPLAFTDNAPF
jgi:hypothetical protein